MKKKKEEDEKEKKEKEEEEEEEKEMHERKLVGVKKVVQSKDENETAIFSSHSRTSIDCTHTVSY